MTHQDPHSRSADAVHQGRPVEAQYARQGRSGVRILWLLIVSAGAAAVLLLGLWFVSQGGFARTNANDGAQVVDSQAFQGDAATPPAADAPTDASGRARPAPTGADAPTDASGRARPAPTGETPNVNAPTQPSN